MLHILKASQENIDSFSWVFTIVSMVFNRQRDKQKKYLGTEHIGALREQTFRHNEYTNCMTVLMTRGGGVDRF